MNTIKIALVGQPNVGKSMLINSISNAHLHVGNFTGVTVEKSEVHFDFQGYTFTVIDLPGTYAFTDYSIEERVTHDYLCNEEYDLILNVVDATNLEKNLQLTAELMTMNKKMMLAINMMDEADAEGLEINGQYLSELTGLPTVQVSAVALTGLEEMLYLAIKTHKALSQELKLIFSEALEEEIVTITKYLDKHKFHAHITNRNIAINLLNNEKKTYRTLHDNPLWTELQPILIEASRHIELHHDTDDIKEVFAEEYMAFNRGVIAETVKAKKTRDYKAHNDGEDRQGLDPSSLWNPYLFVLYVGAVSADL